MTALEDIDAATRTHDLVCIVFTTTLSLLAIGFTLAPFVPLLVAWEAVGVAYLVIVFACFHRQPIRENAHGTRALSARMTEYLSWALPIAAGVTGVASAVALLTTAGTRDGYRWVFDVIGSIAVVVAWLLLQTGFAEVYESVCEGPSDPGVLRFPGGDGQDLTLGDLLYLSFMIGTSFAPSAAQVSAGRIRRVILLHSVTSFFYNTFLIAIASQVLRGAIARG